MALLSGCLTLLGLVGSVAAQTQYTSTASSAVAKAAATALTLSPTSNVAGSKFERFVQIFLENTDYQKAIADSEYRPDTDRMRAGPPNYVAAVGANTFGVTDDGFRRIGSSTKSIVDLLEAKGVSWSVYGEDQPYSGFEGNWVNQKTGKADYVRKHNPVMSFDSVTSDVNRLAKCKNLTMFDKELAANKLPQWMFITPNMTNDAHDSSITVAGKWARNWLTPLLANPKFNIDRTLVILTFDEGSTTGTNQIYAVLLGSAVPSAKVGTTNSTRYNHYSLTKTAEDNWGLGSLGQNDVGASAFF
ncbi:hypothetical protein NEMBOFW57_001395 [Staphylotrichum longicolle]|uniref:Acid phosphatase n=1 Tax=Staphylotrichum longicolle TaxID=669026 RepID=A0AAD4I0S5_9PEZI|nr:hypothetical protein NEMBOFW57_001395 [Staphylotrichum longicolle]